MRSQRTMPVAGTLVGLLGVLGLGLAGQARAQMSGGTGTTGTTGTSGMCSGSITTGAGMVTLAGRTYLARKAQNDGESDTLLLQNAGTVFGLADCQCRSRDIAMGVQMTTPLPQGATGVASTMWLGLSGCSDQTTRVMNNAQCEQVTTASPPGNGKFVLNADEFKTVGQFTIPIPAESLTNPKPVGTASWNWSCDVSGIQSRNVTVLLGPDAMPATCTLPLSVNMGPPVAPQNLNLRSGDSGLTVSWTIPDGTSGIEYYQVLCRKKGVAAPVKSDDFVQNTKYWFSSCVNGTLYRRPLIPGLMDNTVVPPADGVVAPPPPDGGVDMATGSPDGGADVPFAVDGRYICSDKVSATGTSLSQRIDELDNGTEYEVMVVSIDPYGNPAASPVVVGVPQPTQSPLGPYCQDGVCPGGFGCQLTAGPVGAGGLGLLALGGVLLVLRVGRQRRAAARRVA